MSLTYAALAGITDFCKLSSTLDLRTNCRPAKTTQFLTDFHGNGRNTTDWKVIRGNHCAFAICMPQSMGKKQGS